LRHFDEASPWCGTTARFPPNEKLGQLNNCSVARLMSQQHDDSATLAASFWSQFNETVSAEIWE
jgi:hypothetical protein